MAAPIVTAIPPFKVTPAHAAALAAAAPSIPNIGNFWSWIVPIVTPILESKQAALWAFLTIAIALPGWTVSELIANPAKGGTLLLKDIGWALTHKGVPTPAQVKALLA